MNDAGWSWITVGAAVLLLTMVWMLLSLIDRKPYGRSPLSNAERRALDEQVYPKSRTIR